MSGYKFIAALSFLNVQAIHVHESEIVNVVKLFCDGQDTIKAKFESAAELAHFTRNCDGAVVEFERDETVTPNQYTVSWNPYACAEIPAGSDISKYNIDSQLNFAQTQQIGKGENVFQAIIQPFKFIARCQFKEKYELTTDLGVADLTLADGGEGTFSLSFAITRTYANFQDPNPDMIYSPAEMTYHIIKTVSEFPFEDLEYVPVLIQVMKADAVDTAVPIFDVEWDTCGLEALHFSLDYKNNNWQLAYMAFLLDLTENTSYTLGVTLKVCNKNDALSVCNKMRSLCGTEGTLAHVSTGDETTDDSTMDDSTMDDSTTDDGTDDSTTDDTADDSTTDDTTDDSPNGLPPANLVGVPYCSDYPAVLSTYNGCVHLDDVLKQECGTVGKGVPSNEDDIVFRYDAGMNKLIFARNSWNYENAQLTYQGCEAACQEDFGTDICPDPRFNAEMFSLRWGLISLEVFLHELAELPRLAWNGWMGDRDDFKYQFFSHEDMFGGPGSEGINVVEYRDTTGVATALQTDNPGNVIQSIVRKDVPNATCVCSVSL